MLAFIPLEENTVLEKIGGGGAVNSVVDNFYDRIFKDSVLLPFFQNVDMGLLRDKMKGFLKMTLGGTLQFTGKNLRQSHSHLVRFGLSDIHFDRVSIHLDLALKENGVGVQLRENIGSLVEGCRDVVLNR